MPWLLPPLRSLTAGGTWPLLAGDLGSGGDAGRGLRGGLGAGAVLGGGRADARCPRPWRPLPCAGNSRANRAVISLGLADSVGSVSSPGLAFSIPFCQLRSASLAPAAPSSALSFAHYRWQRRRRAVPASWQWRG